MNFSVLADYFAIIDKNGCIESLLSSFFFG